MDKPTILVVNPNTSEAMTVAIDRIAHAAAGASANIATRRVNGQMVVEHGVQHPVLPGQVLKK